MESILLRIDELAAGGDGVGRAPDGRVVFVPFTAPGDLARVRILQLQRRLARGEVEAIVEPGPDRTPPVCGAFGDCGGCAWQHVAYPAQVEAKRKILRDALSRIGGITETGEIPFTPSPSPYGYRSRARVLVRGGRVGYRRRRSHALCAVERCPVLVPVLEKRLTELAAPPPEGGDPPRDGEWELAAGLGEARAVPLGGRSPVAGARRSAVGRSPVSGARRSGGRLVLEAAGERLAFSAGVFAQSNALLLEPLARAVLAAAGSGGVALELFAGAGFLTLGLARAFERVIAVESDAAAAADLRANLRDAGIDSVEVREGRVESALARLEALHPDAVVLDPPRSGLAPAALAGVVRQGPRRIAYLSCDPATLSRDVQGLRERGYALRRVEGFDLFPQTPHVEALAVLEPRSGCTGGSARC